MTFRAVTLGRTPFGQFAMFVECDAKGNRIPNGRTGYAVNRIKKPGCEVPPGWSVSPIPNGVILTIAQQTDDMDAPKYSFEFVHGIEGAAQ